MRAQKLCPRCGTPMIGFGKVEKDGALNEDWHCPTHGHQLTVSTNYGHETEQTPKGSRHA